MFRITMGKGFHLTFANGVTLSTQFGYGNYCDNRNDHSAIYYGKSSTDSNYSGEVKSENCEIGIWDSKDGWLTREMYKEVFGNEEWCADAVLGYINMENWLKILHWCENR